jgi:succinate dehydrogenase / fumarate reductase flavoprotein subunit
MHGGNRLGGNSLSDLLVFGQRAGAGAAAFAKSHSEAVGVHNEQIEGIQRDLLAPFDRESGETPYDVQFDLQETMQTKVGIMRQAEDMQEAVGILKTLQERTQHVRVEGSRLYNPGWHLSWDLRNLTAIAEAVARCALQREESRGGHTRLDFPDTDTEKWENLTSVVVKKDGEMQVGTMPKPQMPEDLKELFAADTAAAH